MSELSPQQRAQMEAALEEDSLAQNLRSQTDAMRNLRDAPSFVAPSFDNADAPVEEINDEQQDDLDADLAELQALAAAERASVEAAAAVEQPVAQLTPQQRVHQAIMSHLRNKDNAPTEADIEGWKAKYGDSAIQVISFSEDDVFVFTHITLAQWKQVQDIARSVQGTAAAETIEAKLQEKIIRSSVLWPALPSNFFEKCHAGFPSTMYEVILLNSYFLSPAQAMTITTQL